MSKITKFISLLLTFALFLPLTVSASAPTISYKVITGRVVNLRDQNCKPITTLGFAKLLFERLDKPSITCKVNNISLKMLYVETVFGTSVAGYVAEYFTKPLLISPVSEKIPVSYIVNNATGLTLRDNNCKKIKVIPNGTKLAVPTGIGGSIQMCMVAGNFYAMTYIMYEGKMYQVAGILLQPAF